MAKYRTPISELNFRIMNVKSLFPIDTYYEWKRVASFNTVKKGPILYLIFSNVTPFFLL